VTAVMFTLYTRRPPFLAPFPMAADEPCVTLHCRRPESHFPSFNPYSSSSSSSSSSSTAAAAAAAAFSFLSFLKALKASLMCEELL